MAFVRALLCAVLFLMISACQITPNKPDEYAIQTLTEATLISQATLLPSITPLPTVTPTSPDLFPIVTLTKPVPPAPSVISTFEFQDEFNQSLGAGWFWVKEDPARHNLSERAGFLRLTLAANDCDNPANNIPLQPPPSGNYELATMVDFTPRENFQLAGLIVFQDDANFLKFGRAFCDLGDRCIGNAVYFDSVQGGKFDDQNFATSSQNPSLIFLRLQKSGSTYTGFISDDGVNWTKVGEHTNGLAPAGVGITAGQSCGGSIAADFDFFTISNQP